MPAALLCAFACLACTAAPRPAGWSGTVSHVSDGDTLWVRPAAGGAPRKIRLHGIDAPELCQAHGREARDALLLQVLHRPVLVEPLQRDDYDRLLARLFVGGQDLGGLLVREGHAWSYRYRRSPGPYAREERAARSARLGLFADSQALRPYAFRRQHGPCTP
ncbi:hypothetical protein ASF44_09820 [Pseudorhodoferax sp. Leaf274]|nr:hypothetical protein ASF44_09820 [Pseudorhodoferax sp. Leaf274]